MLRKEKQSSQIYSLRGSRRSEIKPISHLFNPLFSDQTDVDIDFSRLVGLYEQFSPVRRSGSPTVIKKATNGCIEEVNLAQVIFLKTLGQLVNEVATFARNLEPFERLSQNDQRALLNGAIAELVHIKVRRFKCPQKMAERSEAKSAKRSFASKNSKIRYLVAKLRFALF